MPKYTYPQFSCFYCCCDDGDTEYDEAGSCPKCGETLTAHYNEIHVDEPDRYDD